MKINEITIGRKFNLGNFESLEVRVSVAPDPSDEEGKVWDEAFNSISEKINAEVMKLGVKLK